MGDGGAQLQAFAAVAEKNMKSRNLIGGVILEIMLSIDLAGQFGW
jgi:hypothetical protein